MTGKFKPLTDGLFVAPQINADDVADAAREGVSLIVNNRPDGEEPGQPPGAEIEAAAKEAGLAYVAIPIRGSNVSEVDLDAIDTAIKDASGPVLAYCRSGTRSTVLRSFAAARSGADVDVLIREAANAGYDIEGLRPRLEALSRNGQ